MSQLLHAVLYSRWSVGRWTPPRSQHSWCNPKKPQKTKHAVRIWILFIRNARVCESSVVLTAPENCGLWWRPSRLHWGSSASRPLEGRRRPHCDPESRTTDAAEETTVTFPFNIRDDKIYLNTTLQQLMPSDLREAGLVAVFDHADEVGGPRCDKLWSERPHDWIQQQGTVGNRKTLE